jgi:hypothetical protein
LTKKNKEIPIIDEQVISTDNISEFLSNENIQVITEVPTDSDKHIIIDNDKIQDDLRENNPNREDFKRHIIEVNLLENNPNVINYQLLSTGEVSQLVSEPNKITLLQNRIYKIPVNTNLSTDSENVQIKIYNDVNLEIDIRCIEDGFAHIKVFKNNTVLINHRKLCILYEF